MRHEPECLFLGPDKANLTSFHAYTAAPCRKALQYFGSFSTCSEFCLSPPCPCASNKDIIKFLDIRLKMVMGMGCDLFYVMCIHVYAFMKAVSARSVMPACTHCTNMNK